MFKYIKAVFWALFLSLALGFSAAAVSVQDQFDISDQMVTFGVSQKSFWLGGDRQTSRTESRISYSQAKSIARSHFPGAKVVDISLYKRTYKVRLIKQNGQIIDVLIDTMTGRIR